MTGPGFALEEWQIRLVLPHRPPVLQLDRVDRCTPALDALRATKALSGSDAMLLRRAGAPATLAPSALIEALAQCCGLLVRLRWLTAEGVDLAAFAAGDVGPLGARDIPRSVLAESHARYASPAPPGQVLLLSTRLALSRGDMHQFSASVTGTTEVVSANIMLKFPYHG